VQLSTHNAIDSIRAITKQVQDINVFSSEAAASVEQQGRATREISECVVGASGSAKTVLEVLTQVSNDATATSDSARSVLQASDAVEVAALSLREEIGVFLQKVSDKANEPLLPKVAFHS